MPFCSRCGTQLVSDANFCHSCGAPAVPSAVRRATHSAFSVAGVPRVVVKNTTLGSIEISQSLQKEKEKEQVVVDFDVKDHEYIEWKASQNGDLIVANCRVKSGEFWPAVASLRGPRANVAVRVPVNSNLDLAARYGGVSLSGVSGDVNAETITGNISFRDSEGSASAETKTGLVSFVNHKGRISAFNTAGSITYTGTILGDSTLKTRAGNVDLSLVGNHDLVIDASSKVGRVNIDPSFNVRNLQSEQYMVGHTVHCTIGEGKHRLALETYTGLISIRGS